MKRMVCVLAMGLAVMAVSQANLISNPSFEDNGGSTDGWWTWDGDDPSHSVALDATMASDGANSVQIVSGADVWSAQLGQAGIVTGGGDFTLTFDYNAVTPTDNGAFGINLDWYDGGGNKHWVGWWMPFNYAAAPDPGVWTTYTITGTLDPTTTAVDLKLEVASTATVNVDNFDLTVVPEPATMALLGLGGLMLARRRRK